MIGEIEPIFIYQQSLLFINANSIKRYLSSTLDLWVIYALMINWLITTTINFVTFQLGFFFVNEGF